MDAMGKPSSGLASGTIADLGNYDQCLAVEAPDGDQDIDFTGKSGGQILPVDRMMLNYEGERSDKNFCCYPAMLGK